MTSETHSFVKTAKAGGVAELVSSNWDWAAEQEKAIARACLELCRDLEHLGYLTVELLPETSDYRKWVLRLTAVKPNDK